jgi:hypothetical protein
MSRSAEPASAANHRRRTEDGQARDEQATAPEPVAEPAGQQHQPSERDDVGVHHPLQSVGSGVQAALDGPGSATLTMALSRKMRNSARQETVSVTRRVRGSETVMALTPARRRGHRIDRSRRGSRHGPSGASGGAGGRARGEPRRTALDEGCVQARPFAT